MERSPALCPDWRDGAAYRPLLAADRFILAWEWLRRIPGYAHAARSPAPGGAARQWGLHRFEDPALAAPAARPVWTAQAASPVLAAAATPDPGTTAVDLARLARWASVHTDAAGECLLLSDGLRALRLDIVAGTLGKGPVSLHFLVAGPPALAAQILALRRLEALLRHGRFAAGLHRPEPRAARQVRVLRTADALAAGADQRAIAAALLRGDIQAVGWRDRHPELRLQAQRLVRDARGYLAGGYRRLLRPGTG